MCHQRLKENQFILKNYEFLNIFYQEALHEYSPLFMSKALLKEDLCAKLFDLIIGQYNFFTIIFLLLFIIYFYKLDGQS